MFHTQKQTHKLIQYFSIGLDKESGKSLLPGAVLLFEVDTYKVQNQDCWSCQWPVENGGPDCYCNVPEATLQFKAELKLNTMNPTF